MKYLNCQEAAKLLFEHRLNKLTVSELPKQLIPTSYEDAYLIQEELKLLYLSLKDNITIGKKVGCTSTEGQKQLSIDEPFYGNLYSRFYDVDIDELSSKKFNKPFIEPEIALRIKKDIDISKAPFSLKDIDTLFDGFVCALEIVDFRFNKSLKEIGALNLIATNGASEYWIRNSEIFDLNSINFDNHPVNIFFDNNLVGEGNTNSVMESPLNSALWLINKISKKGETLLKGQFVTTGTCTKAHELIPNSKISADFGQYGKVEFFYK
jgi:2-keto-4-pentenoate hydratase